MFKLVSVLLKQENFAYSFLHSSRDAFFIEGNSQNNGWPKHSGIRSYMSFTPAQEELLRRLFDVADELASRHFNALENPRARIDAVCEAIQYHQYLYAIFDIYLKNVPDAGYEDSILKKQLLKQIKTLHSHLSANAIPISMALLSEQDQIQKKLIRETPEISRKAIPFIKPFSSYVRRSRMGELESHEIDTLSHQDEVIPNLFIGDFAAFKAVTKDNPQHIGLAIRANHEPYDFKPKPGIQIMEIGFQAPDDNSERTWYALASRLDNSFKAIDEALAQNKRVLVSCGMGISRSATVVIAYLMYRYHVSYQQALSFLFHKRYINPNDNFIAGLKAYEKRLQNFAVID